MEEEVIVPESVIADNSRWKCDTCSTRFCKKDQLLKHIVQHSPKASFTSLTQFPKNAKLFCPVKGCIRTRSGSKGARSSKNGRPFKSVFELRRHWLRAHSSVRPFVCPRCATGEKDGVPVRGKKKVFRFALESDLKEHLLVCGQSLVWSCATCPVTCNTKKALVRHCKHFGHDLPNPLVGKGAEETTTRIENMKVEVEIPKELKRKTVVTPNIAVLKGTPQRTKRARRSTATSKSKQTITTPAPLPVLPYHGSVRAEGPYPNNNNNSPRRQPEAMDLKFDDLATDVGSDGCDVTPKRRLVVPGQKLLEMEEPDEGKERETYGTKIKKMKEKRQRENPKEEDESVRTDGGKNVVSGSRLLALEAALSSY